MGENDIFIKITAESNLSETQRELQSVVQRAEELEEEYADLKRQMDDASRTAGRNSEAYRKLAERAMQNRKSIQALTKGVKLSDMSMNALRARAQNLRNALDSVSRSADPRGFEELQEQLEDTENAMEKLEKKSNKATIIGELRVKTLAALSAAYWSLKNAIGGAFRTIVDFEQANATLAAIMGKSQDQIIALTEDAQRLGAITAYTASQMTELQTELAKLGFNEDEILSATEAVQRFATATGADLASAASLAGASLRAFGLDAEEMERAVSVMAVATTKTALDFNALDTAMSTIAPVARSFGFTIEDTTTLLGMLANSGFDASSAATATRNIVLNLADANGKLAKSLGKPIKSMDDLIPALIQLRDKGVNLGEALELTDKRSVSAFNTFLAGADDLEALRKSITGVEEEFKMMESERLNSVAGSMKLLESAWEGLILQFYDSKGLFKDVVDLTASIVGGMQNAVKWIQDNITAVKTFIGVLVTYLATGGAVTLWRKKDIAAIIAQTKAKLADITVTKAARMANEALKRSLLKSPWGLIAIGITAAVTGLALWIKRSREASGVQKALNDSMDKYHELQVENTAKTRAEQTSLNSLVDAIIKTNDNEKLRNDLIEQLQKQYPAFIGNIEKEKITNQLLKDLLVDINGEYERKLALLNKQAKAQAYQETLIDLNKELIKLEQDLTKAQSRKKQNKTREDIKDRQDAIEEVEKGLAQITTDIENSQKELDDFMSVDGIKKRMDEVRASMEESLKLSDAALEDGVKSYYSEEAKIYKAQLDALQIKYDEAKKKADQKRKEDDNIDIKAEQERIKKLREIRLQEEENTYNENSLKIMDEDAYKEQVKLAKKIAEDTAQVQIDALNKTELGEREYNAKVKSIRLDLEKKIKEIDNEESDRQAENTKRRTEMAVDAAEREANALENSEDVDARMDNWNTYYILREKQIKENARLEEEAIRREETNETVAADKIAKVWADANHEITENKKAEVEKRLSILEEELREEQREVTKADDNVTHSEGTGRYLAALDDRLKAETNLYDSQEALLNAKYAARLISYQEYQDQMLEITRNRVNAEVQYETDKMQNITDKFNTALSYMQQASDIVFEALNSQVQAELDALEETYTTDAEEAAKDYNKKLISEEEYEKKKAALEEKQAKYAKASALIQAIINTAMSITSTLGQLGATPWGIASAALAASLGAAQIAVIASKPLAQYAKGRKGGEGEYALVGEKGAEIMYVPSGASIIPHNKIDKQETWGDYGVPRLSVPELPSTNNEVLTYSEHKYMPLSIDYDKLGEAVAKNIPSQKSVSVNIDRNGIVVNDGHDTRKYLNRKYAGSWN